MIDRFNRPDPHDKPRSFSMKAPSLALLVVIVCSLVRAWINIGFDPSPENAYFFLCAEHPAPAYFDGPCGTAALVGAVARWGGPFWPGLGVLWAVAVSWATWRLARRFLDETLSAWAVILLNLMPAFNGQTLTAGPALPFLFFVLMAAGFVRDALRDSGMRWVAWAAAGVSLAGGALFSYHVIIYAIALALLPTIRAGWRRPYHAFGSVWLVLATTLALLPAAMWNHSHGWLPFLGTTLRGLLHLSPSALGAGLADYFVLASPVLGVLGGWALVLAVRRCATDTFSAFLLVCGLPGVVLTVIWVYRGWDASIVMLPPLAFLLPVAIQAVWKRSGTWLWVAAVVAMGFSLMPLGRALRSEGHARLAAGHLLALDERLADDVSGGLFFIAGDADLAAELNYFLRDQVIPPDGHPRVYLRESQDMKTQFSLWPSYEDFVETGEAPDEFFAELRAVNPYKGYSAIYVGREPPDKLPQAIHGAFADVEAVSEVRSAAGPIYLYLCLDYQTLPL